ncbi:hypothetical protein NLI96_g303 [Meripilus lineatus]|uniref:WD40 repeat-like protein n=1 Tax=Meripilus lineatus TaxID=2056292 RepID=A0AAD5VCK7_9APHY|nr:hypothetical protein NLI96_g303 [Physisporinus lineatus]
MPDPFFASNKTRKRKRTTSADTPSKKFARKGSAPTKGKKESTLSISKRRDEELSDETNDEDGASGVDDMDLRAPDIDPNAYESSEEDEDETPAEKRLRLAKLYLESVKQGLSLADGEFDAAEIDRELISARLKQDVMEHSGKVHLFVADSYDLSNTPTLKTRGHRFSVTAAVASEDARWMYTSSKDGSIIKWDLHTGRKAHIFYKARPPKILGKGKGKAPADPLSHVDGHTDEVWALALSPDGRLLASGGKDRRALAFRKASSVQTSTTAIQLYTGSFDRTIKLFDLSPGTMGYVETLFGHQAPVLSLDSLMRETAVSVGGRDKTVRFWKVPEESQLVFRGGGRSGWEDVLEGGMDDAEGDPGASHQPNRKGKGKAKEKFIEGSIECVAMIDESTFVSGGDSGSISLWSTQKKKPIFTQALAHGMDESHVETEDVEIVRKPRWITSIASLRYSDIFASGSWDGEIRLWKVDSKLRSFTLVGSISAPGVVNTLQLFSLPRDVVQNLSWASSASGLESSMPQVNGKSGVPGSGSTAGQKSIVLVAGVGQETKFGRWVTRKGEGVLNGALITVFHPRTS